MLYFFNKTEIEMHFDIIYQNIKNNKELKDIDCKNISIQNVIKKCIYEKMYNQNKFVGEKQIYSLDISEDLKDILYIKVNDELWKYFNKRTRETYSMGRKIFSQIAVQLIFVMIIYFGIIQRFKNIIVSVMPGNIADILLYSIVSDGRKIYIANILFSNNYINFNVFFIRIEE